MNFFLTSGEHLLPSVSGLSTRGTLTLVTTGVKIIFLIFYMVSSVRMAVNMLANQLNHGGSIISRNKIMMNSTICRFQHIGGNFAYTVNNAAWFLCKASCCSHAGNFGVECTEVRQR